MRLVDLDEILIRLDMLHHHTKYSDEQKSAIEDCIDTVRDIPELIDYKSDHDIARKVGYILSNKHPGGLPK